MTVGAVEPPVEGLLCDGWQRLEVDLPLNLGPRPFFDLEGGKFFLIDTWYEGPDYGATPVLVSEDLENWVEAVLPADLDSPIVFSDLAWNGERYLAVIRDSRAAFVSNDGTTWREIDSPGAATRVVWTGENFVSFSYNGGVYTSPDGEDWTWRSTIPTDYYVSDVAWSGATWVVQCLFERFVGEDLAHWRRYSADSATQWAEWGAGRFLLRRQKQGAASVVSVDGRAVDHMFWGLSEEWGYQLSQLIYTGGGFSFVSISFPEDGNEGYRLYFSRDGADWRWEEFLSAPVNSFQFAPWLVWDGRHMYFLTYVSETPTSSQEVQVWVGDCPGLAGGGEVPGMAHVEGVGGSAWQSDVRIVSEAAGTDEVVIDYLPWREPAGASRRRYVRVPGGRPFEINDVVADLFGETGAGTISIRPRSAAVSVTARTWEENGHVGQGIGPVGWSDGIAFGEAATLAGLRDDETARTNIGIVNLTERPIVVRLDLRDGQGTQLALRSVSLGPRQSVQLNGPLSAAAAGSVASGSCRVSTPTEDGRFFVYASRIDNLSDDPEYIRPGPRTPPVPKGFIGVDQ